MHTLDITYIILNALNAMYQSVWRKFGGKGSGSMMVSIDDKTVQYIIIIKFRVDYNIKLHWIILLQ